MNAKFWTVSFVIGAVLSPGVPAASFAPIASQQKTKSQAGSADEELQRRLREQQRTRILAVLSATADDARTWADAAAAVKVLAQIAEVMWDADAEMARGHLLRAWDTTGKIEEPKRERSLFRNESSRTAARREVIVVARKRAPDLSKKWLDQMAQEAEGANRDRGVFDDRTPRSTLLLQMALQIAHENPDAAAALAMESLQDGISFGFQQVLISIQERNVELSQRVFRAALSRLKAFGMLDPNELLILYAYLYSPGRVIAPSAGNSSGQILLAVGRTAPQITAAAQLNPALALEFLQLAGNLLVSAPLPVTTADPAYTARGQLSAINTLIGPMSERLPELALALQSRRQQISTETQVGVVQEAPPNTPPPLAGETGANYAARRVDLLERAAENETSVLARDIGYAKAALATTVESYQRGWDLASKIDSAVLRDNLRNWLTYRASLHFIRQNNLDRAYELIAKNNDPAQRAASLVVGAQRLINAKDPTRASQWLAEARSLVRKADVDEDSVHVTLGIVSAFGKFDKVTAFEVLSEAVRLIEKTNLGPSDDDRVPLIKRFSGLETSDFTYGTEGFSLRSAIGAFGPEQFEDVLGMVNRIRGPELHGLAILELSRKYLKSTEQIRPK